MSTQTSAPTLHPLFIPHTPPSPCMSASAVRASAPHPTLLGHVPSHPFCYTCLAAGAAVGVRRRGRKCHRRQDIRWSGVSTWSWQKEGPVCGYINVPEVLEA